MMMQRRQPTCAVRSGLHALIQRLSVEDFHQLPFEPAAADVQAKSECAGPGFVANGSAYVDAATATATSHCGNKRQRISVSTSSAAAAAIISNERDNRSTPRRPWAWMVQHVLRVLQHYPRGVTLGILASELAATKRKSVPCVLRTVQDVRHAVSSTRAARAGLLPLASVVELRIVDIQRWDGRNFLLTLADAETPVIAAGERPQWGQQTVDAFLHQKFMTAVAEKDGGNKQAGTRDCASTAPGSTAGLIGIGTVVRMAECRVMRNSRLGFRLLPTDTLMPVLHPHKSIRDAQFLVTCLVQEEEVGSVAARQVGAKESHNSVSFTQYSSSPPLAILSLLDAITPWTSPPTQQVEDATMNCITCPYRLLLCTVQVLPKRAVAARPRSERLASDQVEYDRYRGHFRRDTERLRGSVVCQPVLLRDAAGRDFSLLLWDGQCALAKGLSLGDIITVDGAHLCTKPAVVTQNHNRVMRAILHVTELVQELDDGRRWWLEIAPNSIVCQVCTSDEDPRSRRFGPSDSIRDHVRMLQCWRLAKRMLAETGRLVSADGGQTNGVHGTTDPTHMLSNAFVGVEQGSVREPNVIASSPLAHSLKEAAAPRATIDFVEALGPVSIPEVSNHAVVNLSLLARILAVRVLMPTIENSIKRRYNAFVSPARRKQGENRASAAIADKETAGPVAKPSLVLEDRKDTSSSSQKVHEPDAVSLVVSYDSTDATEERLVEIFVCGDALIPMAAKCRVGHIVFFDGLYMTGGQLAARHDGLLPVLFCSAPNKFAVQGHLVNVTLVPGLVTSRALQAGYLSQVSPVVDSLTAECEASANTFVQQEGADLPTTPLESKKKCASMTSPAPPFLGVGNRAKSEDRLNGLSTLLVCARIVRAFLRPPNSFSMRGAGMTDYGGVCGHTRLSQTLHPMIALAHRTCGREVLQVPVEIFSTPRSGASASQPLDGLYEEKSATGTKAAAMVSWRCSFCGVDDTAPLEHQLPRQPLLSLEDCAYVFVDHAYIQIDDGVGTLIVQVPSQVLSTMLSYLPRDLVDACGSLQTPPSAERILSSLCGRTFNFLCFRNGTCSRFSVAQATHVTVSLSVFWAASDLEMQFQIS